MKLNETVWQTACRRFRNVGFRTCGDGEAQSAVGSGSNRRVLRVIARLNFGGPAKHVSWLASGLEDFGYETVLVCGSVPQSEIDVSDFARQLGVRPVYIHEMSREISVWRDVVATIKIFLLMRRVRPHVIHTHTAKAGTVGRLAATLYRLSRLKPNCCSVVHTYHGHIFHSYYGRLKTQVFLLIERALARLTDVLVVISEQQRNEIGTRYNVGRDEQFRLIPIGIDLQPFRDASSNRGILRAEMGISQSAVLVGTVGRLTEVKNQTMFLDVAAKLSLNFPDYCFVVVGDGHLMDSLTEYVERLGISKSVTFLGYRSDPEVFCPALDVLALTSTNEGTPLTLIEALACGVPVISTLVGGVGDMLGAVDSEQDGYSVRDRGLSVCCGDDDAMAKGIARLVTDQDLRAGVAQRGRVYVDRQHGRRGLYGNVAGLYDELLGVTTKETARCVS